MRRAGSALRPEKGDLLQGFGSPTKCTIWLDSFLTVMPAELKVRGRGVWLLKWALKMLWSVSFDSHAFDIMPGCLPGPYALRQSRRKFDELAKRGIRSAA